MKLLATIASLIALISLPSCMQPRYKKKAALPKAAFSFTPLETNIDINFQEDTLRAQLHDIPTVVGSSFIFIDDTVSENNLLFALSCKADEKIVKDFYLTEMENLGWQKIGQQDATDTTFIFQKPKKICIVTIQSSVPEVTVQIKSMKRVSE